MTNAAIPSASLASGGTAKLQGAPGSGSTSTLFQELMQILAESAGLPGAVVPAKTGGGTSSTAETSGAITGSTSKHPKKPAVQQMMSAFVPQGIQPLQTGMATPSQSSKDAVQNGTSALRSQISKVQPERSSGSQLKSPLDAGFLTVASPKVPAGHVSVKQAVEQLHRVFPDITSVVTRVAQQRDVGTPKSTALTAAGKGPIPSPVSRTLSSGSSLPGTPGLHMTGLAMGSAQQEVAALYPKSVIREVNKDPVVTQENVSAHSGQSISSVVAKSLGPWGSATVPVVDNSVAARRQTNALPGWNSALSVRHVQSDFASEVDAQPQAKQQLVHSATETGATFVPLSSPAVSKTMQSRLHTDVLPKADVQRAGPQPQAQSSLAAPQAWLPNVQTLAATTGTPATLNIQGANLYNNFAALVQHQVANQVQTLQVQVHPQGLGSITVSVTHQMQGLAVQVTATNPATAAWLQQDATQLLQAVQAAGLQVSTVNVGLTGQQGFGQQRRSHSGKDQGSPWTAPVESTRAAGQALHGQWEVAGGNGYTISLQA